MAALDPLVAIDIPEVEVDLGEWSYTVPKLPAGRWLVAVLNPQGGSIVPGLLALQDRRDVWADYALGAFTEEELADAERDALEAAAGRPWWEADRLIRSAFTTESWPIISGEMTHRGIDVHVVSLSAWLNWVYMLVVSRCKDDAERTKFEGQLKMPPVGVSPDEIESDEDVAAAFMAAFNEQGTLDGV